MRRIIVVSGIVAVAGGLWAADSAPSTPPHPGGSCRQIVQACEAAGYAKGAHRSDGKGLYLDCLDPILDGKPVDGLTVDPAVVSDCQAKRAKRRAKQEPPAEGDGSASPSGER